MSRAQKGPVLSRLDRPGSRSCNGPGPPAGWSYSDGYHATAVLAHPGALTGFGVGQRGFPENNPTDETQNEGP
jgi:hypothetical protein